MSKAVAVVAILLGIVAHAGAAYWTLIALAFDALDANTVTLLLVGPLSLLPAGLLGLKRPTLAGVWLLIAGTFSFFWHLGVVMDEGFDQLFRSGLSSEAWLPVTLICAPMLLLGTAFLYAGRAPLKAALLSKARSPVVRRCVLIVAAPIAGAVVLGLVYWLLTLPVWTVHVVPEEGRARVFRFDPRASHETRLTLGGVFDPLFEKAGPGGTVLGTHVVKGTRASGKTHTWVVERNPQGLLRILCDGTPVDPNWMLDRPALDHARRTAIRRILEAANRTFPGEPAKR